MKLLSLTDLHSDTTALDAILTHAGSIDVVLLGGDITNFGTPNAAESLVQRARKACPTVMAVAGNCDSAPIDERLIELGVSLFAQGVMIAELAIESTIGSLHLVFQVRDQRVEVLFGQGAVLVYGAAGCWSPGFSLSFAA